MPRLKYERFLAVSSAPIALQKLNALEESSNKLLMEKLAHWLRQFRLPKETGIGQHRLQ